MRYALLIYGNEAQDAQMTPAEQEAQMGQYFAYTQEISATNTMRGGEALLPTGMATTVKVKEGRTLTTDGPFAETKEQLAGFYLIDVENLDQAIGWAAKIPHAASGSIEIRPVMELG
jgi:hypothetical protein